MDQNSLFLIMLLVGVLILGVFFQGGILGGSIASPPTQTEEFGVVHQQNSFFGGFFSPPPSSGEVPEPTPSKPQPKRDELLRQYMNISASNARTNDPAREYIDLYYSSSGPSAINITNWTIANSRGESYKLGSVVNFPNSYTFENTDSLNIPPGSTIHIITGKSPIGLSFRVNKCLPYYEQFHSFTPSLSTSCPAPSQDPGYEQLSDACYQYIRSIYSCRIIYSLPENIESACREYINSHINYSGCVDTHKNDKDFYKNEWWVYLGRSSQVWSDIRDSITIRDENGLAIQSVSYN